ncbi:MAG: protein phosphatase 2C domain-containing protein [Oligoflexia bacterium]|nr:protein phosphatase 2C domain-containing protein [Oligoflexia bacterium]
MSSTHLDCHFYRGKEASLDTSSYVALNPWCKPGSLVIGGACAARSNIGGQVACRLSLEHFVDGVFEHLPLSGNGHGSQGGKEQSLEVLESAFRKANTSVYNFGHKLAAGGRMAASLLGLVVADGIIAAGRVGSGSAYLYRGGELFPFFEHQPEGASESPAEGFVGSNSLVSVELASVPAQDGDLLLVFSSTVGTEQEEGISKSLQRISQDPFSSAEFALNCLIPELGSMAFAVAAHLGPSAVYLRNDMRI